MENTIKQILDLGRQTVTIKSFTTKQTKDGHIYFQVRFENETGGLTQNFFNNELDRNQMETYFRATSPRYNSPFLDENAIKRHFEYSVDQRISINVVEEDNKKYRRAIGYMNIEPTMLSLTRSLYLTKGQNLSQILGFE